MLRWLGSGAGVHVWPKSFALIIVNRRKLLSESGRGCGSQHAGRQHPVGRAGRSPLPRPTPLTSDPLPSPSHPLHRLSCPHSRCDLWPGLAPATWWSSLSTPRQTLFRPEEPTQVCRTEGHCLANLLVTSETDQRRWAADPTVGALDPETAFSLGQVAFFPTPNPQTFTTLDWPQIRCFENFDFWNPRMTKTGCVWDQVMEGPRKHLQ